MFGKSDQEILLENFMEVNFKKLFLFVEEIADCEYNYYRLSLEDVALEGERNATEEEWQKFN